MSLMSAGREERRKAVEKLYKIRLTWMDEDKRRWSVTEEALQVKMIKKTA